MDPAVSSRRNSDCCFVHTLFEPARAAAERFLRAHGGSIGVRSTLGVEKVFPVLRTAGG